MVLCLVTLTDLQKRRAGLSASAELLVIFGPFGLKLPIHVHFGGVLGYDGVPPWNWVPAQGVKNWSAEATRSKKF